MTVEEGKTRVLRSNGKIMLTGEYVVLRGAESLTLPLTKGQTMKITGGNGRPSLDWKTNVNGSFWFGARFSIPEFAIANTNDFPNAQNIREILMAARKINPSFLSGKECIQVENELDFMPEWGLGSSSSLITNIAHWAGIDPFDLHFLVSEGSGYDIAAAESEIPVVYDLQDNRPRIRQVMFDPDFKDKLYFVYSGRKISSAQEVKRFKQLDVTMESLVDEISEITRKIAASVSFKEFVRLIKRHEEIISAFIGKKPVGKTYFRDFSGTVKSLGAWGGDFLLFASDYPREYVVSYFRRKDLKTWFRYAELIAWPKQTANGGARHKI